MGSGLVFDRRISYGATFHAGEPEYLQGNNAFRRAFIQHLAACVMGTSPQYLYGDMRAWGWRGAALLTRDPSYLRHRFPGLSGSAP